MDFYLKRVYYNFEVLIMEFEVNMTLYISGDTHGVLDAGKLKELRATKEDYIIICGDCGVLWDNKSAQQTIGFFESLEATILFIDGNHENFDMLKALPITEYLGGRVHKISDKIYHLIRGEVFEIGGKKILALGGAESHDKEYREEHKTWWRDEAICNSDIRNALSNLSKCDYKVDVVLTHIPPSKFKKQIIQEFTQCGEDIPLYIEPKLANTASEELLKQVEKVVRFKCWFSGHLHTDTHIGKYYSLYDYVVPIKI